MPVAGRLARVCHLPVAGHVGAGGHHRAPRQAAIVLLVIGAGACSVGAAVRGPPAPHRGLSIPEPRVGPSISGRHSMECVNLPLHLCVLPFPPRSQTPGPFPGRMTGVGLRCGPRGWALGSVVAHSWCNQKAELPVGSAPCSGLSPGPSAAPGAGGDTPKANPSHTRHTQPR